MPIKIYVTKWLARFASREGITDASLCEAVKRIEGGLIDADLGGGLVKQRVARAGRGRSGGYRMLIAWRVRERAVLLYGFAKNERQNIGPDELASLREIAAAWLDADPKRITAAIIARELQEVEHGEAQA